MGCLSSTGEARLAVCHEDSQNGVNLDRRLRREAEGYTNIKKCAWDFGDERERLVTASPVMTKSRAPAGGKQLPGERPRETAET